MALANFVEMRDKVASPVFRGQTKRVEHALERALPGRYVSRYELVSFTTMPYAEIDGRIRRQDRTVGAVAARDARGRRGRGAAAEEEKMNEPVRFEGWIEEHRHLLKPPVGNKQLNPGAQDLIVMVVGGPNQRQDYHVDPYEEWFYQIKGNMHVNVIDDGRPRTVHIREGETWLLPGRMPHSPQRPEEGSIGLVVEQVRKPGTLEKFQWYSHTADTATLVHEVELQVSDIAADLPPVFAAFYEQLPELRHPDGSASHARGAFARQPVAVPKSEAEAVGHGRRAEADGQLAQRPAQRRAARQHAHGGAGQHEREPDEHARDHERDQLRQPEQERQHRDGRARGEEAEARQRGGEARPDHLVALVDARRGRAGGARGVVAAQHLAGAPIGLHRLHAAGAVDQRQLVGVDVEVRQHGGGVAGVGHRRGQQLALGAHRHVLARAHRQRARQQPGQAGEQHGRGGGAAADDAEHQREVARPGRRWPRTRPRGTCPRPGPGRGPRARAPPPRGCARRRPWPGVASASAA